MRIIFHENVKVPTGFIELLQKTGHKTFLWLKDKTAFDIFDLYEPDIVVISENDISKSLNKCVEETNGEVLVFNSDDFYFPASPDRNFPANDSKLDIIYFGEYHPILLELCLPESNRNFKIFNSRQLRVPQEVGRVSIEEIAYLINDNVTLIDIENESDPEFTWLAIGQKARIVSNNRRIPANTHFDSREELMKAIQQEKSHIDVKIETYKDRAICFFKKMKLQEEVEKIDNQ